MISIIIINDMEEFDKIQKENIDKDKLPTDDNHPGEEISQENKVVIGDVVEGVEPSPEPPKSKKPNYVLIIVIIVVIIIALFWGIKGCNQKALIDSVSQNLNDISVFFNNFLS